LKAFRILLSLVTAAVLFGAVLWISGVHPREVIELVRECDPAMLLIAFAAYALSYAGRALRFRVLLGSDAPPFAGLLCTVTLHNLFNAVLPARSGELSYIYLMRKKFHVASASGVATLIVARVLDLLCILLYLGVGLVYFGAGLETMTPAMPIGCFAILLVIVVILLNLPRLASWGLGLLAALFKGCGLEEKRFARFVLTKGAETREAFEGIGSRRILITGFILSLAVWLCTYLTCYWILLSFGVVSAAEISFGLSIVGTTALHITCVLPINSFGNLGTWEAGWAAGYIFVGMDEKLAVRTAMGEHLIIFAFLLVLGVIGWIGIQWFGGRDAPDGQKEG
jgi:uncharacterized protein (TIRG00374 family)